MMQTKPKFGFRSFVSVTLPRPATPKRPFDKRTDFKKSMLGLWAYKTASGKIALHRRTNRIASLMFVDYAGEDLATVIVDYRRYATIPVDRIFTAEERPADAA